MSGSQTTFPRPSLVQFPSRGDPMVSFHRYAPAIRGMGDNDISVAQFKIMQRKLIIIWAFSFNLQLQFDGQSRAFQAPLNNRFIVLVAHPRRDSVRWNRPQSTFRVPFCSMPCRSVRSGSRFHEEHNFWIKTHKFEKCKLRPCPTRRQADSLRDRTPIIPGFL